MTEIYRNLQDWQKRRQALEATEISGKEQPISSISRLGFVPTMGALHQGHAALIRRAKNENQHVAVSIYVNQTQFNDPQDFAKYPHTWDADLQLLNELGVDFLLAPTYEQLYPDQYRFQVHEAGLSQRWCGAHRMGHFAGVLTVVLKLLNLVRADRAYFGEKDYQQYLLVRDMVQSFFIPTAIIPCPTVRESDGLAMSSRNVRLNPAARQTAPLLAQILSDSASAEEASFRLQRAGFTVDYVEDFARRRLAAVHLQGVRLIDNVEL